MKPLVFDPKKHRYARLSDGSIEPLFFSDGKGGLDLTHARNFYEVGSGRWCMDINRVYGITICLMHLRSTEFLEERE